MPPRTKPNPKISNRLQTETGALRVLKVPNSFLLSTPSSSQPFHILTPILTILTILTTPNILTTTPCIQPAACGIRDRDRARHGLNQRLTSIPRKPRMPRTRGRQVRIYISVVVGLVQLPAQSVWAGLALCNLS